MSGECLNSIPALFFQKTFVCDLHAQEQGAAVTWRRALNFRGRGCFALRGCIRLPVAPAEPLQRPFAVFFLLGYISAPRSMKAPERDREAKTRKTE